MITTVKQDKINSLIALIAALNSSGTFLSIKGLQLLELTIEKLTPLINEL